MKGRTGLLIIGLLIALIAILAVPLTGAEETVAPQAQYTRADFIELLENKADITSGYAILELRNPTKEGIAITPAKLRVWTERAAGNEATSLEWYIWQYREWETPTQKTNDSDCKTLYQAVFNNETQQEDSVPYQECSTYQAMEKQSAWEWQAFDKPTLIAPGETTKIKLVGKWNAHLGPQSIDWKLEYTPTPENRFTPDWSWWNSDWQKRKSVTCSYTGSDYSAQQSYETLNNYQCFVNVTYDGDMQTDFDDVRFVNSADTTVLDYCPDDQYGKVNGEWAAYYVKTNVNGSFYLYYGNAGAAAGSNCEGTFIVYDNFDDGAHNNTLWTYQKSGTCSDSTTESGGAMHLKGCAFTGVEHEITSDARPPGNNTAWETFFKQHGGTYCTGIMGIGKTQDVCTWDLGEMGGIKNGVSAQSPQVTGYWDVIRHDNSCGVTWGTASNWGCLTSDTLLRFSYLADGTATLYQNITGDSHSHTDTNYVTGNKYYDLTNGNYYAYSFMENDFYWARARKYTGNDSKFSIAFGSEEANGTTTPPLNQTQNYTTGILQPHLFYGQANGATVSAVIDGETKASTSVTNGKYYLEVPGNTTNGEHTVTVSSGTTTNTEFQWKPGETTQANLI